MAAKPDRPLFIQWCPKDALDGMQALDPWEELAYRRTIDLLYCHGGKLPDDDERMGWLTKVGVKRWKKIKPALVAVGKLTVQEGFLRQARVSLVLAETASYISEQSARARARWDKEKGNNNNSGTHAAAHTAASSRHMRPDVQAHMPGGMPVGSTGNAGAYANHQPLSKSPTAPPESVSATEPQQPSAAAADRVGPITERIWQMAGMTQTMDRWRVSGKVDDFTKVRGWIAQGWTEADILDAAQSIILTTPEIKSLWGLLVTVMPDAVHRIRNATNETRTTPGVELNTPEQREFNLAVARYLAHLERKIWLPSYGDINAVPIPVREEANRRLLERVG